MKTTPQPKPKAKYKPKIVFRRDSDEVVITLTDNASGDVYEAVRANAHAAWEISFPSGAVRFFGNERQVRAEIKKLISVFASE